MTATNDTHSEINSIYQYCNCQAPLAKEKIITQINLLQNKYPTHEVIIITNPSENLSDFPYRCIQNSDESLDLFLLCNSKVIILSRSTFALSCLYFGIATDIHVPIWGHSACFGLGLSNIFDRSKFHYFY